MEAKVKPLRDNWTPPPLTMENFNAADRWWRLTHIFLEWNSEENWIYPCFGIIPPERNYASNLPFK